ncbi:MAG: hypothetical protein ABGY75_15375 [Gemmataceae bacterium]
MATAPSPNDLTRQQLDELDVLLQRMLALPLNKPEPAVAFSPPPPLPELPDPPAPRSQPAVGWRADHPATASPPTHLPSVPAIRPAESVIPRLYAPAEDPLPADTGTLRGVDAPALPSGFNPRDDAPPPMQDLDVPSAFGRMNFAEVNPFLDLPPAVEPPSAEPESSARLPVLLWPVAAVNAVIEYVLSWFGPLGRLLTAPWVKTLLGWAGLLLLAVAGYWAARGKGWVSWPRSVGGL